MKSEAPPRLAFYVRAWRHYVFFSILDDGLGVEE
jgi:hypothetical protein